MLLIEIGQAANLPGLLGLASHDVARVVPGTSFSVRDMFCYAAGAAIAVLTERRQNTLPVPRARIWPR